MLLPQGAVIALVDGQKFELYRNAGNLTDPKLEVMPAPKLEPHNKGSGGRHYSSAGNPQPHLLEEDAHAAAAAEWLNQQTLAHKIECLVVIAAPRTLGELRLHYHKQLEAILLQELDKDLVGRAPEDILAVLEAK